MFIIIDRIIFYLTSDNGEEAYIAQIKAIAQKKCWGHKKTEQGIEKATKNDIAGKIIEFVERNYQKTKGTKKNA